MFRTILMSRRLPDSSRMGADPHSGLHPALVMLRDHGLTATAERRPRPDRRTDLQETWSHAASPPVMVLASFVMVAGKLPGVRPWIWTGVHIALAVLLPLTMLVLMHRRGEVADIELTVLKQRQGPLLMATLATGFSLFILETAAAPTALVRLALAYTVLGLVLVLISRHWKISVHCAGVAVAGTIAWLVHGALPALVLGAATMVLARVALGRHTVAQGLAGTLLGCAAALVFVA